MIVRSVAIRQSRRALLNQVCQRALSTDTTTTITTATSTQPPSQSSSPATVSQTPYQRRVPWGKKVVTDPDRIPREYIAMTKLQRKTGKLGSSVQKRFVPGDLLRNPPAPKDVTLELLMASQTHIGHNIALWNPANARYILGIREGVHIIALEETASHLRRAARVVEEISYNAGLILFVGTRRGQMDIVVGMAKIAGACHQFNKWTPGAITNRDVILRQNAVKMVDENDAEREGDDFYAHLRDRRPLAPDLVVVLNPLENSALLHECAVATIPTIGVIDTDMDPSRVTYAIPANDDSLRSIAVIGGVLGRAAEMGKKRRLRDAAQGIVTWQTPADVAQYMGQDAETRGEYQEAARPNATSFSGGRKNLLVTPKPY